MSAADDTETLALWLLRRDPVGVTLAPDEQTRLARIALADGAAVGAALLADHPGRLPHAIASAMGVRVVETSADPWAGPFLRYADYLATPPEIRLFRHSIDSLERDSGLTLAPVFVAHELYHHVEAANRGRSLPRRCAIVRIRFGTWRLGAAIVALSEIAADRCAQTLLDLPYYPAALAQAVVARHAGGIIRNRT